MMTETIGVAFPDAKVAEEVKKMAKKMQQSNSGFVRLCVVEKLEKIRAGQKYESS